MTASRPANRLARSDIRWVMLASITVVLLTALPYLIVAWTTPAGLRFGGVLVNPVDGQSYFAKMRQGLDGAWLFRLPFTAHDEPDALLFTFHMALGHAARFFGLSLTAVYHLARVLGGASLLLTALALIARVFDAAADRRRAWWFVALTSGLGWIGLASADVTIPESNTFFSILTNAHFAASAALMTIVLLAVMDGSKPRAVLGSIALAILQPFAPLAVFAALAAAWLIGRLTASRGWPQRRQVTAAVAAGLSIAPLMLYFYLATQQDPVLKEWSAQNLTPSPPLAEYVMGYGLMGLLAIPGARAGLRRGRDVDVLLVAWAASSALLLYAPFPLQRRFSLGLHVPITLLGVMGLASLTANTAHALKRWLPRIVFVFSLPTTLVLLAATSSAALRPPDGRLFFSADEAAAFDWLREHVPRDAVVIAAPETGLYLPAWADVRVVYGHPFETVDAVKMQTAVEDFFAGTIDRDALAQRTGADYIFFGPREAALGPPAADWQAAYRVGEVTVYQAPR